MINSIKQTKDILSLEDLYYEVEYTERHPGYANLAKIALKHNNLDLWYKYHLKAVKNTKYIKKILPSLNHTRLKGHEFSLLQKIKLINS